LTRNYLVKKKPGYGTNFILTCGHRSLAPEIQTA
jgi:hypothetical protein